jgi:hypothetical protein
MSEAKRVRLIIKGPVVAAKAVGWVNMPPNRRKERWLLLQRRRRRNPQRRS